MLCLITPAGMEKKFEEVGKPVAPNTFLPLPQMTPEEQKRVQSIAEKYGQKLYPIISFYLFLILSIYDLRLPSFR
jgi:hypothetical protein